MDVIWQPIGAGLAVPTDAHCRFTEDAVDLARFAAPTPDDTVCDLGAGSGVLPLLFCRRHPPRQIAAVEREAAFCALLEQAIERFSLSRRIAVFPVDWAQAERMPTAGAWSLVTCNPPYFRYGASRLSDDPLVRAARHEDSPDLLETVCRAAARLMTDDGRFCLCHRPGRMEEVAAALKAAGLTVCRLQAVKATPTAAVSLMLIEARREGARCELPAFVRHPEATHTAVYKKLYR